MTSYSVRSTNAKISRPLTRHTQRKVVVFKDIYTVIFLYSRMLCLKKKKKKQQGVDKI